MRRPRKKDLLELPQSRQQRDVADASGKSHEHAIQRLQHMAQGKLLSLLNAEVDVPDLGLRAGDVPHHGAHRQRQWQRVPVLRGTATRANDNI